MHNMFQIIDLTPMFITDFWHKFTDFQPKKRDTHLLQQTHQFPPPRDHRQNGFINSTASQSGLKLFIFQLLFLD